MAYLLVHLMSDNLEASLVSKGEAFHIRSIPLHTNLKAYLGEAHAILGKHKEKIERVFCIIGQGFSDSESTVISKTFEKPTRIDQNLLNKLKESKIEPEAIENEVLSTKVNGYLITKPIGKEALTLEIAVFKSKALPGVMDELKENIIGSNKKMTVHSFPYVLFKTFNQFLAMEIGRNITTFTSFDDSNQFQTATMDLGINDFIQVIKEKLNVDENVAETLFKMRNEKTLDEDGTKKLNDALLETRKKWTSEIYKTFFELRKGTSLPNKIIIFVSDDWKMFFDDLVRNNDYRDFGAKDTVSNIDLLEHAKVDVSFIKDNLL